MDDAHNIRISPRHPEPAQLPGRARVWCEPLAMGHAEELLKYQRVNAQHLAPWAPMRAPGYFSAVAFSQTLQPQLAEQQAGRALRLVVRLAGSGQLVGVIYFTGISPEPFLACHLGLSLASAQQGRGLMFEALNQALVQVFTPHGLNRVMANHMPRKQRSAARLQRLGFEVEGHARDYLRMAGQWEDHVLRSLLRADAQRLAWWAESPDSLNGLPATGG